MPTLPFLSAAGSEGSLSSEGDPKAFELNAKIRKKLEEEFARGHKAQQTMHTARSRQQKSPAKMDAGGLEVQNRGDWSRSDAKLLQKFLSVFESTFNVEVKLQRWI